MAEPLKGSNILYDGEFIDLTAETQVQNIDEDDVVLITSPEFPKPLKTSSIQDKINSVVTIPIPNTDLLDKIRNPPTATKPLNIDDDCVIITPSPSEIRKQKFSTTSVDNNEDDTENDKVVTPSPLEIRNKKFPITPAAKDEDIVLVTNQTEKISKNRSSQLEIPKLPEHKGPVFLSPLEGQLLCMKKDVQNKALSTSSHTANKPVFAVIPTGTNIPLEPKGPMDQAFCMVRNPAAALQKGVKPQIANPISVTQNVNRSVLASKTNADSTLANKLEKLLAKAPSPDMAKITKISVYNPKNNTNAQKKVRVVNVSPTRTSASTSQISNKSVPASITVKPVSAEVSRVVHSKTRIYTRKTIQHVSAPQTNTSSVELTQLVSTGQGPCKIPTPEVVRTPSFPPETRPNFLLQDQPVSTPHILNKYISTSNFNKPASNSPIVKKQVSTQANMQTTKKLMQINAAIMKSLSTPHTVTTSNVLIPSVTKPATTTAKTTAPVFMSKVLSQKPHHYVRNFKQVKQPVVNPKPSENVAANSKIETVRITSVKNLQSALNNARLSIAANPPVLNKSKSDASDNGQSVVLDPLCANENSTLQEMYETQPVDSGISQIVIQNVYTSDDNFLDISQKPVVQDLNTDVIKPQLTTAQKTSNFVQSLQKVMENSEAKPDFQNKVQIPRIETVAIRKKTQKKTTQSESTFIDLAKLLNDTKQSQSAPVNLSELAETLSAVANITPNENDSSAKDKQKNVVFLLYPMNGEAGITLPSFKQGQVNQVLALVPANSNLVSPGVSNQKKNDLENDDIGLLPLASKKRMQSLPAFENTQTKCDDLLPPVLSKESRTKSLLPPPLVNRFGELLAPVRNESRSPPPLVTRGGKFFVPLTNEEQNAEDVLKDTELGPLKSVTEMQPLGLVTPVDISKIINQGRKRNEPGRCIVNLPVEGYGRFKGFARRQMRHSSCFKEMRDIIKREEKLLAKMEKAAIKYESNFVFCGVSSGDFLPESTIKTETDEFYDVVKLCDDDDEVVESGMVPTITEVVSRVNKEVLHMAKTKQQSHTSKTEEALELIKRGLEMIQSCSKHSAEIKVENLGRKIVTSSEKQKVDRVFIREENDMLSVSLIDKPPRKRRKRNEIDNKKVATTRKNIVSDHEIISSITPSEGSGKQPIVQKRRRRNKEEIELAQKIQGNFYNTLRSTGVVNQGSGGKKRGPRKKIANTDTGGDDLLVVRRVDIIDASGDTQKRGRKRNIL